MEHIIIDWTTKKFSNDRHLMREEIVNSFLGENPGTGTGNNCSKYTYIVARINDHDIYLQRPAQFNNGFDFTLNVSGINFNPDGKATTRPKHSDILDDLKLKKQEDIDSYKKLINEIRLLFNCQELSKNSNMIFFSQGLYVPILLECIKWLFVEQDITYWNYSGRSMLFEEILKI